MKRHLIYSGSVKNLWEVSAAKLEFEYTDAYSVFDWGRMPDALAHKGEALAALGAHFFDRAGDSASWRDARLGSSNWLQPFAGRMRELLDGELETLEQDGQRHHYIERVAANRLLVKRVAAIGPDVHHLGAQTIHHYSGRGWEKRVRLIPLEVVFRFGVPKGSSLLDRLTPAYVAQLGLPSAPVEGQKLDRPIVEFFSKLEDTDRFLTFEQALNYSGLEYATFEKLVARTMLLATWLGGLFEAKGLELWDGKFEWALSDGELVLVDSIGPDELRLLDPKSGTQISKEFLRLYYRRTAWFEATKRAKAAAALQPALDWKDAVRAEAGEPSLLPAEFKAAAEALYPSLALAVTGENPGGLGIPIPKMLDAIRKCLSA